MQFIDRISTASYSSLHYRDGFGLCSLYNVVLRIDLPRKNLLIGRNFEEIRIDFEQQFLYIYYRNNKSCCITFDEIK